MSEDNGDMFAKNTFVFNISREMAIDEGLVAPTAEEAAERNERSEEFRKREAEARRVYTDAVAALDALGGPTDRAVLDLHAPDADGYSVVCSHCCRGDDLEEWPCDTTRAVAGVHQIKLPDMIVYRERDNEPYVWEAGVLGPRFEWTPRSHWIETP